MAEHNQLEVYSALEDNPIIDVEGLCNAWKYTVTEGDLNDLVHEFMITRLRNMISGAMSFTRITYASDTYQELSFLRELLDSRML